MRGKLILERKEIRRGIENRLTEVEFEWVNLQRNCKVNHFILLFTVEGCCILGVWRHGWAGNNKFWVCLQWHILLFVVIWATICFMEIVPFEAHQPSQVYHANKTEKLQRLFTKQRPSWKWADYLGILMVIAMVTTTTACTITLCTPVLEMTCSLYECGLHIARYLEYHLLFNMFTLQTSYSLKWNSLPTATDMLSGLPTINKIICL